MIILELMKPILLADQWAMLGLLDTQIQEANDLVQVIVHTKKVYILDD